MAEKKYGGAHILGVGDERVASHVCGYNEAVNASERKRD